MAVSSLSQMSILSPNHDNGRAGHKICKFTPHYMAGNLTVEQCGNVFLPSSRQASSTYGIGSDGRIACYVDEDNRPWTSSSYDNDVQAITVEVANLDNETGRITNEAWQSLVKLATDVCHRYGFKLNYTGDASGSLTMHKMFAATACPGPWIESHMQELADTVNNNLKTGNYSYSGTASQTGSTTGLATSGGIVTDTAAAYGAGMNAGILPSEDEITQFIITIDEKSPDIDYEKMKAIDVMGVCIHMGTFYDVSHRQNAVFRNPKLKSQVEAANAANIPYALYTTTRASTVQEAKLELHEIDLALRMYPPKLGFWLKLGFQKNRKLNNSIIDAYYEKLVKLGFKDQVGFYDTKARLDLIDWKKYQDDWYWWMDRHVKDVKDIQGIPTPSFFKYDKPDDTLYAPNYNASVFVNSSTSSSSSSSSSSSGTSTASISFYDFMSRGVVSGSGETGGYKFTYYSETVLPGGGLNIPGRHVSGGDNGQGYVMDSDNNIVLARPNGGKWGAGDIINTPFGRGKCYDFCPEGNIDVYVHYP